MTHVGVVSLSLIRRLTFTFWAFLLKYSDQRSGRISEMMRNRGLKKLTVRTRKRLRDDALNTLASYLSHSLPLTPSNERLSLNNASDAGRRSACTRLCFFALYMVSRYFHICLLLHALIDQGQGGDDTFGGFPGKSLRLLSRILGFESVL